MWFAIIIKGPVCNIYWHIMEQKIHMFVFSLLKSLTINSSYFLLLRITIYIKLLQACDFTLTSRLT